MRPKRKSGKTESHGLKSWSDGSWLSQLLSWVWDLQCASCVSGFQFPLLQDQGLGKSCRLPSRALSYIPEAKWMLHWSHPTWVGKAGGTPAPTGGQIRRTQGMPTLGVVSKTVVLLGPGLGRREESATFTRLLLYAGHFVGAFHSPWCLAITAKTQTGWQRG